MNAEVLQKVLTWLGLGGNGAAHGHVHSKSQQSHSHTHGAIDPSITTTARGIWAIKWSFVILVLTAASQVAVVFASGSVALLADTIHNFADATTAIPLWIAFLLVLRRPTATFTYGFGRVEDFAGLLIVLIIFFSALVAGYEAIDRLIYPQPIAQLEWVTIAGIIGFIGNEAVAVLRIRIGRQINSAALIADGYHARTDGLTSLAVVVGAAGVWLGYPLADPIVGLLITTTIFVIVWQSARAVVTRMLDGVEPGTIEKIRHAAEHVQGIDTVVDAKARWLGHRLQADVMILVDDRLPLSAANAITHALQRELHAHIPALSVANIQFRSPNDLGAEGHHH